MKKALLIFVIAIIVLIALRFLFSRIGYSIYNKALKKYNPPNITVEKVKEERIIKTFDAPARVESINKVTIIPRISGYLLKTYFKEGSIVKKGDLLFLIEPREYVNNVSVASAEVNKIAAQLEYANKQVLRGQELVKQDYIAKAKYDELVSTRNSLQAQLSAAKSKYNDTQRNLSYTKIYSPIDGLIGTIDITIGNYVTPSSGQLTTIYSINPIYVAFTLSDEDYSLLKQIDYNSNKKRKVKLYFNSGEAYKDAGYQDFSDNKIDPVTGSIKLRATFLNPDNKLLHGEFVKVKIYTNNYISLPVVPLSAVLENQEGKYVYKLDSENCPNISYIETDGQYKNYWLVRKGVKAGDIIATSGLQKIIPNKRVNIVNGK